MVLGTRVRVVYANGCIDEDQFTSAASDEELIALLQRLAERGGKTERSLSTAKPILHLRLPDGARLTVIYMVTSRPVVVIRRHRIKDVSLDDMVAMGAITPTLKAFLEAADPRAHEHHDRRPGQRREDDAAARDRRRDPAARSGSACWRPSANWVSTRPAGTRGRSASRSAKASARRVRTAGPEGQLTIDDLFPHMLRLSANRIIVGEVRAEEIVAMFDAMNTTYGSLCTIHSRDEHGVFDRLAELLLRYGASKNREGAYLTIGNALDFVVYVNMEEYPGRRPRRYVSSVMEVHGLGEGRQLSRSRIFAPGPDGLAVPTVDPAERAARRRVAGRRLRHAAAADPGSAPTPRRWPMSAPTVGAVLRCAALIAGADRRRASVSSAASGAAGSPDRRAGSTTSATRRCIGVRTCSPPAARRRRVICWSSAPLALVGRLAIHRHPDRRPGRRRRGHRRRRGCSAPAGAEKRVDRPAGGDRDLDPAPGRPGALRSAACTRRSSVSADGRAGRDRRRGRPSSPPSCAAMCPPGTRCDRSPTGSPTRAATR